MIDEDHYTPEVVYEAGSYIFTREKIGTRYVSLGVRILVDPADPEDIKQVHALQDAITVTQPGGPGRFEVSNWDQSSQKKVRDALLALANTLGSVAVQFGGCDGQIPNCLPSGWNYMDRLYRPRPEILDGSWKFPDAEPAS